MASVNRAPGKGKGGFVCQSAPAASSLAPPSDPTSNQQSNQQSGSGTSPAQMSSSAQPYDHSFDYGSHQPGPWPAQSPLSGLPQHGIPANQFFDMTVDPNRSIDSGMNAAGLIGDRPPGAPLPTQPGYQPLPIPTLARHLGSFAPQDWQAEWEPRDRSAEKEPVPKWNGEYPATTLKPWLRDLRL